MSALGALEFGLRIPDLWQAEAVTALRAGQDVVVHAPTGAGKTYVFELLQPSLRGQAVYTVPTRALANDKLAEWRAAGWDVGITTGDVSEKPDARVVVATLETQRDRHLRGKNCPRLLVVDEYQMLADPERGAHYELALALAPLETQLLLLSGSVANPADVVAWLRRLGRDAVLVETHERPVPLEEVALDAIPYRIDDKIRGFWPRHVARALAADYGPVLLFAPRRRAAEEMARDLAAALPADDPLALSAEQAALTGEGVARLLRRRVAYHHSGLSYHLRAGVIEPLAKAGQLRAVVATTGLAAGVNFSLRSVLITDTRYASRGFERHLLPEELLQMFGRAGRRGLDDRGYVLVAPGRPRLSDAHAKKLRRAAAVDWPTLLSVMAAATGEKAAPPLASAVALNRRLFSTQTVLLGAEASLADGPRPCGLWVDAERARFAQPQNVEIRNFFGAWEAAEAAGPVPAALSELLVRNAATGDWRLALQDAAFFKNVGRTELNLCKLRDDSAATTPWRYGRELPLAVALSAHEVRLAKGLRALLEPLGSEWQGRNWPAGGRLGRAVFAERVLPLIPALSGGGKLHATVERGALLVARIDYVGQTLPAYRDSTGRALFQPEQRRNYPTLCQHCSRLPICETDDAAMTPALAWRKLGLIAPDGTPTQRGRVFSFFSHGEGLAIAAALEDETYPIETLLFDLANLRAGHRFAEDAGDSRLGGHLAARCQETYGRNADFPGYLEMGVPPDYGDGAAAAVAVWLTEPARRKALLGETLRAGDVERALTEWRSLLRGIATAPELTDWPRWQALRAAARSRVRAAPAGAAPVFPPLLPSQMLRSRHR
ncbi:MAG: DEAD/DEAH box helicase [Verrucomicrobia bacterium]|nr:DEAD/DEAH box helicase [Verrucomicrobiota bacterium]